MRSDEGQAEARPVGRLHDVRRAIDDDELAVVVDVADVTRVQPSVPQRLGRRCVVALIAAEDRRRAQQDLAVGGDLKLGARAAVCRPCARRTSPSRCIAAKRAALGLPVALLEVHADRAEELHDLGVQRPAAAVRPADAREAELLAHRAQRDELRQRELQAQRTGDAAVAQARGDGALADAASPAEGPALEPPGLADAHVDLAEHALPVRGAQNSTRGPISRRSERTVAADSGKFSVHADCSAHATAITCSPIQASGRKLRTVVTAGDGVLGHQARRRPQQVRVREHHELRRTGRARRRAEHRDVGGPSQRHLPLPPARLTLVAAALDVGELVQIRLLVTGKAARVVVDDPLDGVGGAVAP